MGQNNINLSVLTYNTHLFGDLAAYKVIQPFLAILYKDDDRADQLVVDVLQSGCGLIDAYMELEKDTPGYTVNGNTNLLWQHFGGSDCLPNCTEERIDYIFYKNSSDNTVQLSPTKAQVVDTNDLLKVAKDGNLDVSDHYPLFVEFQLSFPS